MVVVEFTYEEMKKRIDLPLEEMVDSLSSLGAPSEFEPGVKKIITELTPNRPDWYSMEGLARALRAYHGKGSPSYATKRSEFTVIVDKSVKEVRPYTVCAVIKGLKFNDERIRDMVLLQEKLLGTLGRKVKKFGLGIYPLHAIEFPVHYTTMKPSEIRYVPLGSEKEMSAPEILSEHKKGQQYGYLLSGHSRYAVFKDATGKIMALIPIVNSAETGKVDADTKDIFVEVSGTEINACKSALNILACTFADMGGTVFEVTMEYGKEKFQSPDLRPRSMKLDISKVNKVLGTSFSDKDISRYLKRMGYVYEDGKVSIPPYRADVLELIDVIEDIAIAYGYNNFIPTLPDFFNPGEAVKKYDPVDRVLRGMGFMETKTFILTNRDKLSTIGYTGNLVEISNPSSVDFTVVRPNLVLDMLETLSTNRMKGLPQKFYEIGIVHDDHGAGDRLVFGIVDNKIEFSDARGYLQTLFGELGRTFDMKKEENQVFERDLSCSISSGGEIMGIFGKLDRKVAERFGLSFDVYICELKLV